MSLPAPLLALVIVLFPAAVGRSDDFESQGKARTAYERARETILTRAAAQEKAIPEQYRAALERLRGAMQKAGDLEGWTAVDAEIKRFSAEGEVAGSARADWPEVLVALHSRSAEMLAEVPIERNRHIVELTNRYLEGLERLKRDLTRAGKIDQAVAVKEEIGRASTSPEFTAAQFDLEVIEAARQEAEEIRVRYLVPREMPAPFHA